MPRNTTRIDSDQLPPKVREVIDAFNACFNNSASNTLIRHYREDAVFLQYRGTLTAGKIGRFTNYARGVIEIDAIAPGFFEIGLFCSDRMILEDMPRQRAIAWTAPGPDLAPGEIKSYQIRKEEIDRQRRIDPSLPAAWPARKPKAPAAPAAPKPNRVEM